MSRILKFLTQIFYIFDGVISSLLMSTVIHEMYLFNTQVPDEILIDRCVGRRLDPVTGKIYHIKNFPPESEEIITRIITHPDDNEEKV